MKLKDAIKHLKEIGEYNGSRFKKYCAKSA